MASAHQKPGFKRVARGVAGVAVSVSLVWLIVGRVDGRALSNALATTHLGWLLAAAGAFGFGLALAAARWRLPLDMSGLGRPWPFVLRVATVGHCFNMALMGPVGGDLVKAALFARWTRQSGAKTLATCGIDRLLAGGGSVIYGALTLCLILSGGGLERLASLHLEGPAWRIPVLAAAVVAILAWALRRRFRGNDFVRRSWSSFQDVFRRFGESRRVAVTGVFLSLLNQLVWTSVLGWCLYAVAGGRVDWATTLWVFPIVSTIAALPISVAGAGVREGTSVLLLSACGVSEVDALAAALLTSGIYISWAIVGAALGWREERLNAKLRAQPLAAGQ